MFQVLVAQSSHLFRIDQCIHQGIEFHFSFDSSDCLSKMHQHQYDLIVLHNAINKSGQVDVHAILSESNRRNLEVFLISSKMDEHVIDVLFRYAISHYFVEPVSLQTLFQKIETMKGSNENGILAKRAAELLHTLGIPNSVQGYIYLQEAIVNCYYCEWYKKGMSRQLYPLLAAHHNTTSAAVEKSIRHAIELAFSQCDSGALYDFFKGTIRMDKAKATNSQFISMCVDYIKNEEL